MGLHPRIPKPLATLNYFMTYISASLTDSSRLIPRAQFFFSNAMQRVPVWREIANPWTGKKQLAVSAVNVCVCVPTQQNPSSSHQQSTRNTSRTLKNEVEPVWSYGAFEWLVFPTFPSHDIHMISWSVPGFSSLMHNSSRHLQHHHWAPHCPAYFGVAVQIQSKEEWICNILKPKLQPPVLADVCKTHLIRRSCSEIIGYQTVSRWSLKNWQKMATWPWNSTFTEDYTWNITINRSSL